MSAAGWRAAQPTVAFLGRIPGTRVFSDLERNPESEEVPGAVVVRAKSSLLYFNVEQVRDILRGEKLEEHVGPIDRTVSVGDVVQQVQGTTRST